MTAQLSLLLLQLAFIVANSSLVLHARPLPSNFHHNIHMFAGFVLIFLLVMLLSAEVGDVQSYYVVSLLLMLVLLPVGYAFVYFKDEHNARDAIRHLNNTPFGNGGLRLTVEWAKGERGRYHGGSGSNPIPVKTLFVINFDPVHTRDFDIERHFERYGKIRSVRINRNYAFVRFETQEGATRALQCTHLSKIFDRVISVEYASMDDDDERYGNDSPRGDYGRREYGASASRRSPSPAHRRILRSSPEYGRYTGPSSGPRTRSPDSLRYRRGDYGRHEYGSSRRSPSPAHRRHIRSSPDYGRYTGPSSGPSTRSPDSVRYRRGDYGRHEYGPSRRSPSPASPEYGRYAGPSGPSTSSTDRVRYRSRSPVRRWRN